MKLVGLALGAAGVYLMTKTATRPDLKHFAPGEFGLWWPLMNADLLIKLDAFRDAWGGPVKISAANGGIGRHQGREGNSQHNVDKWGEVRAVDAFPMVQVRPGEYRYMDSEADRARAFNTAKKVGFTGIGLYTDTKPGNMLHVDTRDSGGRVALWSRVAGNYKSIYEVLV